MTPKECNVLGRFELDDQPEGEPARSWIQVLIEGEFKHPTYGKFSISEEDLSGFATDIEERADRIPIDFDHESAHGKTRAAGWYTGKTKVEGDPKALWAEVEWTPVGAEAIRSKEYRYVSGEFGWQWRDAYGKVKKGWRMAATALTNRAFLPDMAAVTLSDQSLADLMGPKLDADDPRLVALAAQLGLDPLEVLALTQWTQEFIDELPDESFLHIDDEKNRHFPIKDATGKVELAHLRIAIDRLDKSEFSDELKLELADEAKKLLAQETAPPKDEPDNNDLPEGVTMTNEVLELLGLPEHADDQSILATLKKRDEENAKLKEKVTALEQQSADSVLLAQRVAELEESGRLRDIESILADEVRTGRVLPVETKQLAESFKDDPDALKSLLNARPPAVFAKYMKEQGYSGSGLDTPDPHLVALKDEFKGGDPVDEDSAKLHLAALSILREQGKEHDYSIDDYMKACDQAQRASIAG